jgi:hypothetical protein
VPVTAQFTAEEWSIVVEAPLLAGARVAAAARGGTLREGFAMREAYAAARELGGASALLDALVADTPELDLDGEPGAAATERLRAALAVLRAKATPHDVEAYKGFVLAVAHSAAEANREGGFAGIGGEELHEREQAALDELAAVLGH